MLVPVLNAGFSQFGISVFTMHDQYFPPLPPARQLDSVPGLIEGPAFMGWPPGFFVHKKAPTVLVDGNPGIQQGHDVGYLIPHFAIPMNAFCPVHMLVSKHKVMFPVTSVQLEGKPVGTYLIFLGGLICANPVSLPTGALIKIKGTVMTNASFSDILRGVGYIVLDIVFDLMWNMFKKPLLKLKFIKSTQFGITDYAAILARMDGYFVDMGIEELNRIMQAIIKDYAEQIIVGVMKELADKITQHVLKSWVLSPIVTGGARGAPAIGRGKAAWKPFDKERW